MGKKTIYTCDLCKEDFDSTGKNEQGDALIGFDWGHNDDLIPLGIDDANIHICDDCIKRVERSATRLLSEVKP